MYYLCAMNTTNDSNSTQTLETIKASFYLLDFLICSVFTFLITQTVWSSTVLKNEVRYFFLCHHLVCLTLFFGLGTIFSYIRTFEVFAPVLVCWLLFAAQITFGKAAQLTLAIMALNTCIAVCWPLKYLTFVHSIKSKLILCLWIISLLDPVVSLFYEGIQKGPQEIVRLDPTCPTTLSSTLSRIAGVAFILLLAIIILASYIIMFREGKRAGHFTTSNCQARRTILIHGLQIALHMFPTLINISIGGTNKYIILHLTSFIIFSLAQCLSPVVYGLRCTELRQKFIERQHCCGLCNIYSAESYQMNTTSKTED
ncbi:odorant receptor 131-2-like [Eleutherodactylus coqui]|uniref:odorant receptor 131-2-like n=1 Tax=Eleutherodactylus coqui TaxID=57060 RepID=UPI003463599F